MIEKAFINGVIYTSDAKNPIASAVGIKNGKFVYVGTNEGVKELIEKNTEVIDLNGCFVMAGITDGHCHLFGWQLGKQSAMDLSECETVEEYLSYIKQYILAHPEKKEYRGRGWVNSAFDNMCPTANLLSGLVSDRPIALRSTDGHSLWVNEYLLKLAGIDENTISPDGGKIEVDVNDKPNGCLRDSAMVLVQKYLNDFTVEEYEKAILEGQKHYISLGYTGYLEALLNENYIENLHKAYKKLSEEGRLIQQVYGNFGIFPTDDAIGRVQQAKQWMNETKGNKYEVVSIKLFVDGVVEGATALLKKPYTTDESYYGKDSWANEQLFDEVILEANKNDIPVHVHSIGDAAAYKVISSIKKAIKETGNKNLRNIIAHLQLIDKKDIREMYKNNIMALFNPWANKEKGFFEEAEVYYLGRDRANQEYLTKSFIDGGVKCSFGTDFPLDPLHNPFVAMQVFAQRMNSNDPSTLLNEEEQLDIKTIIDIFTNGTAYQMGKEASKGSIEIGKDADMIVLSQNLLEIDTSTIRDTEVLSTIIDGEIVYKK